jgi:hypothetical protein
LCLRVCLIVPVRHRMTRSALLRKPQCPQTASAATPCRRMSGNCSDPRQNELHKGV